MSAHQVIEESQPLLTEILSQIGLYEVGTPIDLSALLDPFSRWIETEEVGPEDTAFVASLIGAFLCEFLIQLESAVRFVRDERIFLQLPIQDGMVREFEPYSVAFGLAQGHGTVANFLRELTSKEKTKHEAN